MAASILVVYVPLRNKFDGQWPAKREQLRRQIESSQHEAGFWDSPLILENMNKWNERQRAAFAKFVRFDSLKKYTEIWFVGEGVSESAREVLRCAKEFDVKVVNHAPPQSLLWRQIRMFDIWYSKVRYRDAINTRRQIV